MLARLFVVPLVVMATFSSARALIVPYTEDFSANSANWLTGPTGALVDATWVAAGGVDGGAYVQALATNSVGAFGGPIVFRGNASANASGGAFFGDWLSGGVTSFSASVLHDAPTSLNFYVRLSAGGGAGASSNPIEVPTGTWTLLTIPIVNSLGPSGVFQSYGSSSFNSIFGNISEVQIALSANPPVGATYTLGLDRVSVVPEPGTFTLVALSSLVLATLRRFRRARSAP